MILNELKVIEIVNPFLNYNEFLIIFERQLINSQFASTMLNGGFVIKKLKL